MKIIEINAVSTLEHTHAKLNDARISAITFLQGVEDAQKLHMPDAIRQLRRSMTLYETISTRLLSLTRTSFLTHYYEDVHSAVIEELKEIRSMFHSVLQADNTQFNQHYQRYLTILQERKE